MTLNSQKKGKDYERHIAKLISKALDINVRRTPCSGGLDIKGDLRNLSGALEDCVIECKKQQKLNIWQCIQQAKDQAGYKNWALIFSRNFEGDYVCIDINYWLELIEKSECPEGLKGK